MSRRARPASTSSIRRRRRPPRWRTESHAAPAAQTLPRCSRPDGVGASRPTIIGSAPAIPLISSPYERNIVSIVPTAMDQATSPRARVSLPPRVASAGPGLRSGVVNCAAYEDGVRVADVEVADVHEVLTDARAASSGSACTSRTRSCCARCSASSTCTISPSRTPTTRTSGPSSRSTTTRCSWSCARRR